MNSSVSRRVLPNRGFALVVTLSLMILLTVVAVGLLSLSSISLRASGAQAANSVARANARMALMMALGDLQKAAGDDRRITVDGSIFDGAQNPNVVGVWKSWSPKLAENPLLAAPNYATAKDSRFVGWLTSNANLPELTNKDWGKTGMLASPIELFTQKSDGFSLSGSKIDVLKGKSSAGAMAWTIVQDATRAKINVGGPEDNQRVLNDDLQAQARPSLAKSDSFKQPGNDWNQRANRVISMAQAKLDSDLWKGGATAPENAHFTSQGLGLLTDAVNGGLKTDLSLGFEMPYSDFTQNTWGSLKNPFRATSVPQFTTPSSYKVQRPLFKPLTASGSTHVRLNFDPANVDFDFPAAAVPTFDTLRSFYLTPYHLYDTADGPTAFERGMEHVALKAQTTSTSPGLTPSNASSQTSYRPVLDRVLYVLSIGVGADQEVRLIVTPLVTLWNPYNVALEIEGAVLYPWMDFPFQAKWNIGSNPEQSVAMSQMMGVQFASNNSHGRSVNPYFFASITPSGNLPGTAGQSLRFKPGEVRLFAPTSQSPVEYVANGSIRSRTLPLIPVTSPTQLSIRGGFAIPMKNPVTGIGIANRKMAVTDSASLTLVPSTGSNYPFSVGLEDATRAMSSNPTDATRGKLVCDVQTVNFSANGSASTLTSPRVPYSEMASPALRKPFGMIETYHRVASDTTASRRSDLLFTTNPRQPFINRYLTSGDFQAGPHYETRTQQLSTLNNLIQTDNNGRSAYYGASNSAGSGGKSQLSFFEVPQSSLLSLAAFQHADLSGTAYSTAYQVGNSWASAYLARTTTAENLPQAPGGSGDATYSRDPMPAYDYSYLVNETLWDSFYFSGVSPKIRPGTASGSPAVWSTNVANVTGSYKSVLTDFIDDPVGHPLRNPRMRFHAGNSSLTDLKTDLLKPEGCIKLAAHLCVDGAFNINSTSEKAWIAFLSGMRDRDFKVLDKNGLVVGAPSGGKTAFPRFHDPIGTDTDSWMGFRSLSDSQVEQLAREIVLQVKSRGPFLSLAEFVNRRVDNTALGLKGAIQTAIDNSGLNTGVLYDTFDPSPAYPSKGRSNINPANTGVGIPGYLTQADVLQSIAPVMTARSDTFTIRSFGEAKDPSGKVLAAVWCEAVVQRVPEFVDETNPSHASLAELNQTNQVFGRKFSIISFRYLANNEVKL